MKRKQLQVEGREFTSAHFATIFAEQLAERERRRVTIMQRDDDQLPWYVLRTITPKGDLHGTETS